MKKVPFSYPDHHLSAARDLTITQTISMGVTMTGTVASCSVVIGDDSILEQVVWEGYFLATVNTDVGVSQILINNSLVAVGNGVRRDVISECRAGCSADAAAASHLFSQIFSVHPMRVFIPKNTILWHSGVVTTGSWTMNCFLHLRTV